MRLSPQTTHTEQIEVLASFGLTEQDVEQQEAQKEARQCAWCLFEQGLPMGNGSHGSCDHHAKGALRLYKAIQAIKPISKQEKKEHYHGTV